MARTVTAVETHAPDNDAPSIRPGDVVAGKYRIDALVGEGGMGVVFAATHERLDERVAIKVLRPSFAASKGAVERFLREARATAKLKNGHVTRVLDVDTLPDGAPYLVMELLEGEDLSSMLARTGPLPTADAVRYLLDACEAVAEAHALGIVHRDLKPANLFLVKAPSGATHVKVLDFGISRIMAGSAVKRGVETGANVIIGTPAYMAPEQHVSADSADERTDVFALGIILYELLTGRKPWQGDASVVIYSLMMTTQPASVTARRPDVPASISEIVARCLKLEPAERHASVRELAAALAPLIDARFPESGSRLLVPPPSAVGPQAPVSTPSIDVAPPPRRTGVIVGIAIGFVVLVGIAIGIARTPPKSVQPETSSGLSAPPTPATTEPPFAVTIPPPPPTTTAETAAPSASHAPIVRKITPAKPTATASAAPAASATADPYKHRTGF